MNLFIFLLLLPPTLALKKQEKIELTKTIFYAIEEYAQTFGFENDASRNIFEGSLFTAAKIETPAERRTHLVEFYITRGAANITRIATITSTQLIHMTFGLKGYIFGNDPSILLKRTFALIFDKKFRNAEERVKENIITCQMINCTAENIQNLRYELRNLAAVFTQKVMDQIRNWDDVQPDDYNMKHFFNTIVEFATDPQIDQEDKIQKIGEFYEQKVSQLYKIKMAEKLAADFMKTFGQLEKIEPERLESVSWNVAALAINDEYWKLSEEERYAKLEKVLFPVD